MSKKILIRTLSVFFGMSLIAGCGGSSGSSGNSSGELTLVQLGGDRQGAPSGNYDPYAKYDGQRVAADDRFDGEGIDDFVVRIEQRSHQSPQYDAAQGAQGAGSGTAGQGVAGTGQAVQGQAVQADDGRIPGTVPPNTGKPVYNTNANSGAAAVAASGSGRGTVKSGSGFVYPPTGTTPLHKEYDAALARITRDNNLNGGRADLIAFIKRYPTSPLVPNALYWIGETFYSQRQYEEAILVFKRVGIDYPNTDKAADSLLKLALSYRAVGDEANARDFARMLKADYPQSRAARNNIIQQL